MLQTKRNNFIVSLVFFIHASAIADSTTQTPDCPQSVIIKNQEIVPENGWVVAVEKWRKGSPGKYPLVDGVFPTESRAPVIGDLHPPALHGDRRIAGYIMPLGYDNLDDFMYPENAKEKNPIPYWTLPLKDTNDKSRWIYLCQADRGSLVAYKLVPSNVGKCTYLQPKKKNIGWGESKLVCEK